MTDQQLNELLAQGATDEAVDALVKELRAVHLLKLNFETESNQTHCEIVLLRNECIRLRGVVSRLADFIEQSHGNADKDISDDLMDLMDALFPEEQEEERETLARVGRGHART